MHYLTFYLSFSCIVLLFVLILFLDATICNNKQFQNKVIDFIGERLVDIHEYSFFESCNQRTQLNSVLLEAALHFNFGSDRQMHWWWLVLFLKILVYTSREESI